MAEPYRSCPRHRLELVERRDGSLRCPRGHVARIWVVVVAGEPVAGGRLDGAVTVWLPARLHELRGFLEAETERSAV